MATTKRAASWTEMPRPETVIQSRKYLDACLQWLLAATDDTEQGDLTMHNHPWSFDDIPQKETLGLFDDRVRLLKSASCCLCNTTQVDTWKVGIANPFTHAQYMILCSQCSDSASNDLEVSRRRSVS